MLSLDKNKVFVKGLSLKFLESSEGFKKLKDSERKEYIRQYEAIKTRFLNSLEDDEEIEDDILLNEEDLALMEEEAMLNMAMNELDGQSIEQNLISLKMTAEAESEQESQVMEIFKCLNPFQKTIKVLENKLGIEQSESDLLSSTNIQGNSNSSELSTIVENFNTIFSNFNGENSSIVPTSAQDVFDSITASTEGLYTTTTNAVLSNEVYNISQESSNSNDYKQVPNSDSDFSVSTEEQENDLKIFDVIIARYSTNDEIFFKTWEIPEEYKKSEEIERVKDNIVMNLVNVINTENSLENLENKEEESIKLSVESSINYLKNNEVI